MSVSPYHIDEPTRLGLVAHARAIRARLAVRRAAREFAAACDRFGAATAESSAEARALVDALQRFGAVSGAAVRDWK